jgi:hypothetical protein
MGQSLFGYDVEVTTQATPHMAQVTYCGTHVLTGTLVEVQAYMALIASGMIERAQ